MAPEGRPTKLTKAGLVKHLVDKLDYTKKDADLLVKAFFRSMADALRSGEGIELRGFGSFRVRGRAQRVGRNPRNGQPVNVPPKTVVYFKLGKELRNRLVTEKGRGDLVGGDPMDGGTDLGNGE
jgi:integration host factor subunit beta